MISNKTKTSILTIAVLCILTAGMVFKLDLFATSGDLYAQIQRFVEVAQAVNKFYFEKIDSPKLMDGAINGLLNELDPHSVYIPSEQMDEVNEQFDGEFSGIGIEFVVHEKVPLIISALDGSPANKVGLHSGDRIVSIAGQPTYGISENGVRDKLLGAKGTQITITIQRPGIEQSFEVTITRDRIPIQSITAAFMLDNKTALIRIGLFAKTTDSELTEALLRLQAEGMQKLILDLRNNSGGYLDQAVDIAGKFLTDGKRIVYTRGRIPGSSEDYYATGTGKYARLPIIILINHGSASASEIVAGAIQDWDRGLVVGTTSFGKGLVQHQVRLKDGSAVRVTIAQYYTPSGRLIQRSYDKGVEAYISEGYDDYDPNAAQDSASAKPIFTTSIGRQVFGGGGITPDLEVKPAELSPSTIKLIQKQIIFNFAAEIAREQAHLASDFTQFRHHFKVTNRMFETLINQATSKHSKISAPEILQDKAFVNRRLKSQIARHLWGTTEYTQMEIVSDPQVLEAMGHFKEAAKIAELTLE